MPNESDGTTLYASPSRTSSIAPRASMVCVPVTVSPLMMKLDGTWVEYVRSSSVEAETPSSNLVRTGMPIATSGNRVSVAPCPDPPVVTWRHSGSNWNVNAVRPHHWRSEELIGDAPHEPSAAGLIGDAGSNSPAEPPVPIARELSSPVG